MITSEDISGITEATETVLSRTDHIVGSTSLPDYRTHLTALENTKDALVSVENALQRSIDEQKNQLRDMKRLKQKVVDHWTRTKVAGNDLRFASSRPIPPSH